MSVRAERIRTNRTHHEPLTTYRDVGDAIRALRTRIDGEIVLPGDPEWDDTRQAWNLAVDQRPFAVALVDSAEDVLAVVEFARAQGLRIAPQGTGHGARSLDALDDTILVKTSRLRGVEIDAEARRARVEAGALWADVVEPAAEQGFVVLHGSSPDVGVVGYTLGGGMGWLARSRGLSANSVTAVEIVTADGRLVRADCDKEPDLFWAVRGGGGSFRHRDSNRDHALRGTGAVCGRHVLAGRACRRGAADLARLGRDCARRRHLGRTDPALPAHPRHPRGLARRQLRPRRGRLRRPGERGRRARRAPTRGRAGD